LTVKRQKERLFTKKKRSSDTDATEAEAVPIGANAGSNRRCFRRLFACYRQKPKKPSEHLCLSTAGTQRRRRLYGSVARSTCKDEEEVNASQNSRPGAKPLPKPPKLAPIETPPRYKHHGKNRTRVFGLRACRMSHAKNYRRLARARVFFVRHCPVHVRSQNTEEGVCTPLYGVLSQST